MQRLIELVQGKNIAIFGTGTSASRLNKVLSTINLTVNKFVDNNKAKWKDKFLAKTIINPDKLSINEDYIIIASMYEKEIGEQLNKLGFREKEHYIFGRKILFKDNELYYVNTKERLEFPYIQKYLSLKDYKSDNDAEFEIKQLNIIKDLIPLKKPFLLSENQIPSFMFPHHKLPQGLVEYSILKDGISYDYNGAIFNSEGIMLYEYSTYNTLNTNIWDAQRIKHYNFEKSQPELVKIKGRVGVVTSIWGQDNYYHWMFEELPRFHLLQQTGIEIDYYLSNYAMTRFQIDTLQSIGIDTKKIVSSSENYAIQADELVIPYAPAFDSGYIPKWICDFIKSIHIEKVKNIRMNAPRIYIARGDVAHKKVVNEELLIGILEKYEFKICYMEKYTQEEQAALFYNAEVIIAPHGAGLSNLVYCQEGTKVLEIFNPAYVPVMFWSICSQMNLEYYCSLGDRTEYMYSDSIKEKLNVKDILVNIEEIYKFLNIINGGSDFEL